ncbi:MAG: nitroreductase [Francisellaceae bacterium]|jgi:nitroreductase
MDVKDALTSRKSTRSFLNENVPKKLIAEILSFARCAPSGVNTQPWKVAVVSGKAKLTLQSKIETAFRNGVKSHSDYQYYPQTWIEEFKLRRKECGLLMYKTLDISREDKEKQLNQWASNYRAFDAPVMLLFFADKVIEKGSYMDYGMFLQSIMLMAQSLGLATCPQAALAEYPDIIKQELGYPEDSILLCGMALGYEDKEAIVNSYRTSREDISVFTKYFE